MDTTTYCVEVLRCDPAWKAFQDVVRPYTDNYIDFVGYISSAHNPYCENLSSFMFINRIKTSVRKAKGTSIVIKFFPREHLILSIITKRHKLL